MNIKNFSIIFALSLLVIPRVQADFMTYSCTYASLSAGFPSSQQTQYDEDNESLSEFATNPCYSLLGTEEELRSPFSKLFTPKLLKNRNGRNIDSSLYLTLWELCNPSTNNANYSDDSKSPVEDTFNDGLADTGNPTFEPYEADTEQHTPAGDLAARQFASPDAYQLSAFSSF